jgi:hypothetical protein
MKIDKTIIELLKTKDNLRKEIVDISDIVHDDIKLSLKDFYFIKINELTFEEKSPRKEALENVISSIRVDGITFVYLINGNKMGLNFILV